MRWRGIATQLSLSCTGRPSSWPGELSTSLDAQQNREAHLTRRPTECEIDAQASVEHFLAEAKRLIRERLLRELRYRPQLSGSLAVKIKIRNGVPFAIEETLTDNILVDPIAKQR